jgi:glutaconyl-CoA/methylmalonyl-CoA decarboxylase subunit gamma
MKYSVRIEDQSYEVEIEDIHARPVIARVDGERFEVHPENGTKPEVREETGSASPIQAPRPSTSQSTGTGELTAPLPGTVVEVFVKAGDEVEVGKVVLIIEAMKMKNSIRSTRAGKVAEILVSTGQTVAHKQALVKFE